ncbi:MAG TPA: hypothetical protein VJ141_03100 [Candidatus Limnocylindrales bacterium]|nr:hypothetical protein [Candidatus Limnocylindrales bacterium]
MAKRTRGSRRDRRRAARRGSVAPPPPRPAALTETAVPAAPEEAAAARPPRAAPPAPLPSSAPHSPTSVRPGSVLAAKAAQEYRYVALDLRRIIVVVGTLFAAMLALWVAVDVLRVVTV